MKVKKGDIVKATNTNKDCGHIKGDLLKVKDHGHLYGTIIADNLTRPYLTESRRTGALLLEDDYKVVSRLISEPCESYGDRKIYFLGIPLITIREADK